MGAVGMPVHMDPAILLRLLQKKEKIFNKTKKERYTRALTSFRNHLLQVEKEKKACI